MNPMLISVAATAAAPSVSRPLSPPDAGVALLAAATSLVADLERGRTIDAQALRAAFQDATGLWLTDYDGSLREDLPDRLKATGLTSEIISWKLRLFVPTGAPGPAILADVMQRHPPVRITDKAAA